MREVVRVLSRCLPLALIAMMSLLSPWFGTASSPKTVSPTRGDTARSAVNSPITLRTGSFRLTFKPAQGQLLVQAPRGSAGLAIHSLSASPELSLLSHVRTVRHTAVGLQLDGAVTWGTFQFTLSIPAAGLLHLQLRITARGDLPQPSIELGDIQLVGAPATGLQGVLPAPPVAGTTLFLSIPSMATHVLYVANLTALGSFFARTNSGVTQSNFPYPQAGGKGALVGVGPEGSFGYVPPPFSLNNIPRGVSLPILDSYLALTTNRGMAPDLYLHLLGNVYDVMPHPHLAAANWPALAGREVRNLSNGANWIQINHHRYLRSYVSDQRAAPELITQAGILAGVLAYQHRFHRSVPFAADLASNLPTFFDPHYRTVMNGLGHDPQATGESWYAVDNLLSLLQLTQLGNSAARGLLLQSVGAIITLAHHNHYRFPQTFAYRNLQGQGSGTEADVAGGYAWLMLGLHDLTSDPRYLHEAELALPAVAHDGFSLSYETHMTAYTAAAAQRLYRLTGRAAFHQVAILALANLFHVTRLWDCTYGYCRSGHGYHTYFGLNPLPWSDYIAMLEQYESWLALRDYQSYAAGEPLYIRDLVAGFVQNTPRILQFTLPPLLPPGTATATPSEYSFVPHNRLGWYIPLEDLREGESNSGVIGQEIYGAGGPFMLAAYGK